MSTLPPAAIPESPARTGLADRFDDWLAAGGRRIAQVVLTRAGDGWLLTHEADADRAGRGSLTRHTDPSDAIDIARCSADGRFRPLKSAPTLATGWELALADAAEVRLALDFLYPAAFANWIRWSDGEISPPSLRDALARQSGIYRLAAMVTDDEARETVAATCADTHCLRRILWDLAPDRKWNALPPEKTSCRRDPARAIPELPVLCTDPCPILLGAARQTVKRRRKKDG